MALNNQNFSFWPSLNFILFFENCKKIYPNDDNLKITCTHQKKNKNNISIFVKKPAMQQINLLHLCSNIVAPIIFHYYNHRCICAVINKNSYLQKCVCTWPLSLPTCLMTQSRHLVHSGAITDRFILAWTHSEQPLTWAPGLLNTVLLMNTYR